MQLEEKGEREGLIKKKKLKQTTTTKNNQYFCLDSNIGCVQSLQFFFSAFVSRRWNSEGVQMCTPTQKKIERREDAFCLPVRHNTVVH